MRRFKVTKTQLLFWQCFQSANSNYKSELVFENGHFKNVQNGKPQILFGKKLSKLVCDENALKMIFV